MQGNLSQVSIPVWILITRRWYLSASAWVGYGMISLDMASAPTPAWIAIVKCVISSPARLPAVKTATYRVAVGVPTAGIRG
jgi:hypothetical protein